MKLTSCHIAILIMLAIFAFTSWNMVKRNEKLQSNIDIKEGEKNELKREKVAVEDSLKSYIKYSESMNDLMESMKIEIAEAKIKFNEKLHSKVRDALQSDDSAAMRQLTNHLAAERNQIIE